MTNAILITNLSKSYGETVVFRDFSARLPLGETTVITGVSGGGKSTLLRLILGLETPDGGEIGLGESLAVPAAELSGGMRRRCALARSLCAESDLLVLDEPFKGLDEANRRAAMDAVRAVSDDKTVLLVTHDAAEAEFFGGNRLSVP